MFMFINITVCDIFVSRKIEGSRSLIWHEGSDWVDIAKQKSRNIFFITHNNNNNKSICLGFDYAWATDTFDAY